MEQTLDVLVPKMVELPKIVSQDRIQQRTVGQIVDVPVPQAVEELAEVFRVFSQDRIQQRAVEQTIDTPAISLVEKIVELPATQTRAETQQVANTHVQRVVNTVEVEMPKITKQTVQKPIIHEKINQLTKHIEVPQFLTRVADMLVVAQRQVSMVQKATEASQMQVVEKTVEGLQQIVEKTAGTPETQTIQGGQTSESSGIALIRQMGQAETVEVIEIGVPLPAESGRPISVTAPVSEASPVVVEYKQPVPEEYVAPAPAISRAHAFVVVEYITSASAVAHAVPVTAMTAAPNSLHS